MHFLRNVLEQAQENGVAVGHFNVADFLLKAVFAAAQELQVPVIVGAQSGSVQKPNAQVQDLKVNSGHYSLRLRTIRPDDARDRGPVIMYFHGAGWVMGDATTHDRLVRELAIGADATVVFVDYDRARSIAIRLLSNKLMQQLVMSQSTPKNWALTQHVSWSPATVWAATWQQLFHFLPGKGLAQQ